MKKAIKLTLVAVLALSTTSLFAQKFGRVNSQEIILAMPETAEMQKNLEAYQQELTQSMETMNVEYNNKLQDLQKNLNTYTDAIREMKQKELNDLLNRSREFQEVASRDLEKRQGELITPILEKARTAINKVAKEGGYLCIFDVSAGSLAYFDEAALTDIGASVKSELGIKNTPAATPAN